MATTITMPKLGLTMTEGTISEWKKSEGDSVEKGEIIFVVSTDKLSYEVEAPESGILAKIMVGEGGSAPVADPLAIISEPGEEIEDMQPQAAVEEAAVPQESEKEEETAVPVKTEKKPTTEKKADRKRIVVIGAGPGGYVAAIKAAQLGADVTIVDRKWLGGTCLNVGCIPTKVLLHTVELFNAVREGSMIGLMADNVRVDWKSLMKRKEQIVGQLVGGVKGLLSANGVTIIEGEASFVSEKEIQVKTEGGVKTIEADNVVIATGSAPAMPPIPGIDSEGVISSNEALSLEEVPSSMAIIGGGVIGVEFASIYASLGTRVTIVEMLPEILPNIDEDIVQIIKASLSRKGVEFHTASKVTGFSKNGGSVDVAVSTSEGDIVINSDKVLVAIGRRPVTDGLGLDNIGVRTNRGSIVTDEYLCTNKPGIYSIGDCSSPIMLAHVASHEGEVAVENIMGHEKKMDYKTNPGCIYTSPEIAGVGLTEKEARDKGYDVKIGKFPLVANGKSMIMNETEGMIKFVVDGKYDEILGVHMVGPRATDLIVEGALALRLEATVEEIVSTIHAHPTVGEALGEAALDVNGVAIHIPPRK